VFNTTITFCPGFGIFMLMLVFWYDSARQRKVQGKFIKALVFLFHTCYIKYAKVIKYHIGLSYFPEQTSLIFFGAWSQEVF
jgi:hypothetical protein